MKVPMWLFVTALLIQLAVSIFVLLTLTSQPKPPIVKCYGDNQVWMSQQGDMWIIPAAPECLK